MTYEIEQGPTEELLIDQATKGRAPIPEVIVNKPELLPGLGFYYYAFNALSSCRDMAFGVGRIPWNAVNDLSLRYGMSLSELERFWDLICRVDSVYIVLKTKQIKDQNAATAPPPPDKGTAPAITGPRR